MNTDRDKFQGKHESRWSPYRYGISPTILIKWLTCREQFKVEYIDGWRSNRLKLALLFGSCCGKVLETAYEKPNPPTKKTIVKGIKAFARKEKENVEPITEKNREILELATGLVEVVMPIYTQCYEGDWTGDEEDYLFASNAATPFEWIGTELKFSIPFGNVEITGRYDGWFKDELRLDWLMDTKCLSRITDSDIVDTLGVDIQFMTYLWSFWKKTNKVPAGMVVNVIRRPGQIRKEGETLTTFLLRVAKDVEDKKKWAHYFKRYEFQCDKEQLEEFEASFLKPVIQDLLSWWHGTTPHYTNYLNLIGKFGKCDMFDPIVKGDYSGCRKKS